MGRRSQNGKRAGSFSIECEELLRRAQCCIARAAMVTDPDSKAALLEMAAMLEASLNEPRQASGSECRSEEVMPVYQCFLIDSADKVREVDTIESPSDADAVFRGEHMLRGASYAAAIEVWEHGRLIRHIEREDFQEQR